MKIKKTPLAGLYRLEYEVRVDERGEFFRTFCKNELMQAGIDFTIVQINISKTHAKGAIRGLHFQKPPNAEAKVVSCIAGAIYDVAVDLREESPTYGQWYAAELSAENNTALLIPEGFAHGFQTLSVDAAVHYLMSEYYVAEKASGVVWNDPQLNISWPLKPSVIAEKDQQWPLLSDDNL